MAKKIKKRYFVLGEKASVFWDPKTRLKVTSVDDATPTAYEGSLSPRIRAAISAGHIREVSEPVPDGDVVESEQEANKGAAAEGGYKGKGSAKVSEADSEEEEAEETEEEETEETPDFEAMTDKQLLDYYRATFEVTESDVKKFQKMKKAEKVTFLSKA